VIRKFILDPRFGRIMRKVVRAMKPWSWCMIGGRAVEVWTNPPQTPDVDLLAMVSDEDTAELERRYKKENIVLDQRPWSGLGAPTLFLRDKTLDVELDILGAYDPLHFAIIERAPVKSVQAVAFPVAFAEDLVMLKAQSATDPGRPTDKRGRDRKAILAIAQSVALNTVYICDTLERQPHGWADALALLRFLKVV
jgi:hypothetical protein